MILAIIAIILTIINLIIAVYVWKPKKYTQQVCRFLYDETGDCFYMIKNNNVIRIFRLTGEKTIIHRATKCEITNKNT